MNVFQKAGMRIAQDAGTEVHIKGDMNVVIEAGAMITLKVGGSFVTVGPSGVFISGPMVLINSGGAAGSGAGCSPVAPKIAKEADKAVPGKVDKVQSKGGKKAKASPSSTAATLKQAAESGAPFCEICEKMKKEKQAKG
jgi:type VI secretion system secreted protein VgrG